MISNRSAFALYNCEDPAVWRGIHGKYWDVVEVKSAKKGKDPGKLLGLDKWFQEELPSAISTRPDRSLTRAELVKIMEWKLTVSTVETESSVKLTFYWSHANKHHFSAQLSTSVPLKARLSLMIGCSFPERKVQPRLQQLIGSNSEEAVHSVTSKAFNLLPDVQAAITELCKLKGVGPATASAVLVAGAPGEIAFMSDEAVESIAELRPVEYTAKHYALFLQKVLQKTSQLNKADIQQDWTPHRVELCLWTWMVADQIQPSLLQEFSLMDVAAKETNQKPEKRKTAEEKPSKRLKTDRS